MHIRHKLLANKLKYNKKLVVDFHTLCQIMLCIITTPVICWSQRKIIILYALNTKHQTYIVCNRRQTWEESCACKRVQLLWLVQCYLAELGQEKEPGKRKINTERGKKNYSGKNSQRFLYLHTLWPIICGHLTITDMFFEHTTPELVDL